MKAREKVQKTLQLLTETYGERELKPRRDPMHELISTMLSHRTTQANEAKAYHAMMDKYKTYEAVMQANTSELADTLDAAQFAYNKAVNIQKTLKIIFEQRKEFSIDFLKDLPVDEALKWLDDLPGVGVKTATLVLLFCFAMPVLPVDTHVHRINLRLGTIPPKTSADKAHDLLLELLPKDAKIIFNFHKLLLKHGQQVCRFTHPKHENCTLSSICDYYNSLGDDMKKKIIEKRQKLLKKALQKEKKTTGEKL